MEYSAKMWIPKRTFLIDRFLSIVSYRSFLIDPTSLAFPPHYSPYCSSLSRALHSQRVIARYLSPSLQSMRP
jgi:hypothetical protein